MAEVTRWPDTMQASMWDPCLVDRLSVTIRNRLPLPPWRERSGNYLELLLPPDMVLVFVFIVQIQQCCSVDGVQVCDERLAFLGHDIAFVLFDLKRDTPRPTGMLSMHRTLPRVERCLPTAQCRLWKRALTQSVHLDRFTNDDIDWDTVRA